MSEKESISKINEDSQLKAQFLKDLHGVMVKHGVQGSEVDKLLAAGAASNISPVFSTVAVTITA